MNATAKLLTAALLLAGLAAQPAHAQRIGPSPLTVNVTRTKTDRGEQQIGLKITIRNMSNKPTDVRLEALFIAEPTYGGGREMIFCERKTSKSFEPGESHDFNTESDAGSDRLYEASGVYYSYSSLKIKGYLTRVFANGELVNVTGSVPSLQKTGWDEKALTKLGYSGGAKPAPVTEPARVVRDEPPAEPTPEVTTEPIRKPRAVMPRDEDDAPSTPRPVVTTPVTPEPYKPTPVVTQPTPKPVVSPTWNEATYSATAKRYNAAVDAYQNWLAKRGTQSTLKNIENELHECATAFESIEAGAPASYNVPGLVTRCRQTIFAVHATMQAPQ